MPVKLIFVYNADSGSLNALGHSLQKLISPSTYSCSLCKLTHGFFTEKKMWADFLEGTSFKTEFLHRDEFVATYPDYPEREFPVIFFESEQGLEILMDNKNLNEIPDLPSLIKEVSGSVSKDSSIKRNT